MKQAKLHVAAVTLCLLPVFFIQSVSGGTKTGAQKKVPLENEISELRTDMNLLPQLRSEGEYFFHEMATTRYSSISSYDSQGSDGQEINLIKPLDSKPVYFRFKLKNPLQANLLTFKVIKPKTSGSGNELTIEDGIVWINPEYCKTENDEMSSRQFSNFVITATSSQTIEIVYDLEAFASKDDTAQPLATFSGRIVFAQKLPNIICKSRITGDIKTDIPLAIQIDPGSLGGKKGKLEILLRGSTEISASGNGFIKNEHANIWISEIPSLTSTSYTLSVNTPEAFTGTFQVSLLDDQSNIISSFTGDIVIPTTFDQDEVNALKAIANANLNSLDFQKFISTEGWKDSREHSSNDYKVGVKWNTETPSHIESLFINDQFSVLTDLDLSAFKYLRSLDLSNNYLLSSLNLSQQATLECLNAYNTSLRFSTVRLAEGVQKMEGYSFTTLKGKEFGTPIDDYNSLAASGTGIDLSSEAAIKGKSTTYQWYKVTQNENSEETRESVTMETVSGSPGKFVLTGQPGEFYRCVLTNPVFPNWTIQTILIKISRGNVEYAEQDLDGLRKLAEDNPHFTKLQEFVNTEGWKLENWNSYQDIIKTDWKVGENNVARLTHLYIEPDYGRENQDYIDQLDVSAFDELVHLECERYNRITSLDLSKNTKLEILRIYTEKMESLDVSYCPNLKELTFREEGIWSSGYSLNLLASLNITGCTKLTKLQLVDSPLTNLDISNLSLLETLFIEACENLQIKGDISRLEYLQELGLNKTTQFAQYITNLPTSVVRLYCLKTDYPLPGSDALGRLVELGLPQSTKSLDLTQTPKLKKLVLWDSEMRFSTLTRADNMSNPYQYTGESYYILPNSSRDNRPVFKIGDKIDLSSEANIGDKTTYTWVDRHFNIEDTNTFTEDPEHPGVFTVNQNVKSGNYTCIMSNPLFTSRSTVNSWGGWRVLFDCRLEGEAIEDNFSESDVMTLKKIVDASSSELLKSWWSEGAWKKNDVYNKKVAVFWDNNNPRRLISLTFMDLDNELTSELNVSSLDALKELACPNNAITKVILPDNTTELNTLVLVGNPLTALIISPYANLETLYIQSTGIKSCDLSNNMKLRTLYCNETDITLSNDLSIYPDLLELGVPTGQKTLNLQGVPKLTKLDLTGSKLKFSDIQNPHQLENINSTVSIITGDISGKAMSYGSKMDCSAEMNVGGKASQVSWNSVSASGVETPLQGGANGIYDIDEKLAPGSKLVGTFTNSLFPGWTLKIGTTIYSCAGDANLDKTVNVQDITATVSEILNDTPNKVTPFGDLEADVNGDGRLEVSDVVGIVGIIQDKPLVLENALRSDYTPVVELSKDKMGFLYMDAPVAIAGIQLTFTGVKGTIPLLGEAARFVQASVAGDTLRLLAYSTDGASLPSGKSVLMQIPAGARLVDAVFSDANARSLKAGGDGIATANETIAVKTTELSIRNYPNPFRNTTTFSYTLKEDAQEASIRIFSANGALIETLVGLPTAMGENSYPCTLSLPAGVYFYQLTVKGVKSMKVSKSNLFIIK